MRRQGCARAADLEALEKQPLRSLLLLSTMLVEAKDRPTAAALLQVANRRFPDDFWVRLLQGSISLLECLSLTRRRQHACTPRPWLLRPKSPIARINLATALQSQRRSDEASRELREAIRLKPDYARAHACLGSILSHQGKQDEAVAELREAIRLAPVDSQSQLHLGYALQSTGKLDEAVAAFREATRLAPLTPGLTPTSVRPYRSKKSTTRPSLRTVKRFDSGPTTPTPTADSATHWTPRGSPARPSPRSAKWSGSSPTTPSITSALATPVQMQGELDDAVAAYREAIRLKSDYAEAYFNLSTVLQEQERFDEAKEAYAEAIRLKPDIGEEL